MRVSLVNPSRFMRAVALASTLQTYDKVSTNARMRKDEGQLAIYSVYIGVWTLRADGWKRVSKSEIDVCTVELEACNGQNRRGDGKD